MSKLREIIEQNTNQHISLNMFNVGGEINGKDVKILAEWLKADKNVVSVNLGVHQMGDKGIEILAEALKSNYILKTLFLSTNQIGDKGAKAISEALKVNNTLTFLCLADNKIGNEGIQLLSKALNNGKLTYLSLAGNQIGNEGAEAYASALNNGNIKNTLTSIDIQCNQIGDKGAKAISEALKVNNTLTSINLTANQIGNDGVKALAQALKANEKVITIFLCSNRIGDEGVNALAKMLEANKTIVNIGIQNNQITPQGVKVLAKALMLNKTVAYIGLNNNQIGAEGAKAFAEVIKVNKVINCVSFGGGQVSNEGIKALAEALKLNKTVSTIYLNNNYIGNEGIKVFAESLKINNTLMSIYLDNNRIGYEGAKAIIEALVINKKVSTLYLNDNIIGDQGVNALNESLKINKITTRVPLENNQKDETIIDSVVVPSKVEVKENLTFLKSNQNQKVIEEKENISFDTTMKSKVEYIKSAIAPKTKEVSYSNEKVSKLLNMLSSDAVKTVINLEQGKITADKVERLLKPTVEDGKTVVAALHLHEASWASLIIKKQADDSVQVLYNDPRGIPFVQEKNVKSLINTIRNLEEEASVIDLRQTQQITDNDSAAFVIDNLLTLAKTDTNGMKKPALQKLLSKQDQVNNIKQNHLIMQDTNPWYSDIKLNKLLHLKLDTNKQVSIAPTIEFERKDLLLENIAVAAKEVMTNNKIAVMPIHLHSNHWTALVIKKQNDGSLQVLYNDPKGNSLMSEKNSGALLKAISKVNAEFTLIDIRLKQQDNDDDCGPYTVENLVKLATSNTNNLHKDQLQKLLQVNSNFNDTALFIRIEQATELEKAGISVLPPGYNNNKFIDKSELYSDFNAESINTTEVEFMPPSPVTESHEVETIGVSTNY